MKPRRQTNAKNLSKTSRDGIGDTVLPATEEPLQPKTAPVNPRRIATGTMDLEE